ncbi:rrp15-like protein [Anaeramoeba flamelloides]|uniref:Rrp15-like protein n=1 Tax=Anaeramoeba flamelloides TaxID=1746091 RepID=A0AAV7YX24_9EUKA|nr:rrp15-like protein [Anaeramoeba flamelloides]KAJ6228510.1 rrp15-like protein [Anaeramoeba flamelloides]
MTEQPKNYDELKTMIDDIKKKKLEKVKQSKRKKKKKQQDKDKNKHDQVSTITSEEIDSRFAGKLSSILSEPTTETTEQNIFSQSKKAQKQIEELRKEKLERKRKRKINLMKKDRDLIGFVEPQNTKFESKLNKIAVRGVVSLFNAIRVQQEELSGSFNQEISKMEFFDLVKGEKRKIVNSSNKSRNESKNNGAESRSEITHKNRWDVLNEQFMMGAELKDWDKQEEEIVHDSKKSRFNNKKSQQKTKKKVKVDPNDDFEFEEENEKEM